MFASFVFTFANCLPNIHFTFWIWGNEFGYDCPVPDHYLLKIVATVFRNHIGKQCFLYRTAAVFLIKITT